MKTSWKMSLPTLALAALGACTASRDANGPRVPSFSRVGDDGSPGAVYVATNATAANEVLVFPRAGDGTLGGGQGAGEVGAQGWGGTDAGPPVVARRECGEQRGVGVRGGAGRARVEGP